jgi:hypothetical protein
VTNACREAVTMRAEKLSMTGRESAHCAANTFISRRAQDEGSGLYLFPYLLFISFILGNTLLPLILLVTCEGLFSHNVPK